MENCRGFAPPKAGKDHADPLNYRPISLTSNVGKAMEAMVNNRLTHYRDVNYLLSVCWSGGGGNVLFNDALNQFYLRLYGVGPMVKDHSDSERGNPLPPHRLLFPISSKGSFICTIPRPLVH